MPGVYYNENDRQKAAWLRHLIEEGAIAHGIVDQRSIVEVQPEDLHGFVQCHFFAGIGLWSLCLRRAGWRDDRPVWTGSCPCGPFSRAGKQGGFDDPRHLWPEWFRLISVSRPVVLFGEQSDVADAWLDLVQADLEADGYAVGSAIIPAAGFGGAHQRHRIGFVADADNAQWWSERAPWHDGDWPTPGRVQSDRDVGNGRPTLRLADAHGGHPRDAILQRGGEHGLIEKDGSVGVVQDDTNDRGRKRGRPDNGQNSAWPGGGSHVRAPGLLGGAGVDWIACRDGRWRPIEPGTFPLVDAHPSRLGLLRGFGDGIDVEAFTNLIGAYMDVAPARTAA